MIRFQAYKFQLMPTGEQERNMRRFAGACRYVFNKALVLQQERRKQGEKKLSYEDLCKFLTVWRHAPETAWLAETPCALQQQKLMDVERAYTNFFAKRARFPHFKKRGEHESYRYPDKDKIKLEQENNRIHLPKLGWVRYRNSREVLGTVKNVTVSESCGKWYASIQTQREVEVPVPQGGAVGIDVGVVHLATLSDGVATIPNGPHIKPLDSFKHQENALRKAQQKMSRKKRGSANWRKAKARVQKIHARIANARNDYLHKLTAKISENAFVAVEDLQVKNMTRSAAGTVEAPGKNVRAKSGLNKAILDQGWGEIRRELEYKTNWKGGLLVAGAAPYTSQTCPRCDHVAAENRKTQEIFKCVNCGFQENADVVASINVLRVGHAQMARVQREG